ncbi:primosomal replication protein PriC [Aliidiomarina sp.]|uniref:primosomal replication protein PriC n=1 Tax=Aliidiomarina sp. TaxID=1872439 RepID=UPI003A4D4D33
MSDMESVAASISESEAKTAAVFRALRERAQRRSPELTREWFAQSVFKTRSDKVVAYLDEAEKNARMLAEISPSSPTYPFVRDVVEQQLNALVQALYKD